MNDLQYQAWVGSLSKARLEQEKSNATWVCQNSKDQEAIDSANNKLEIIKKVTDEVSGKLR
jgi:hypothetical protein